jgi:hypothetical protein
MKVGEYVYARTNADLLNEVLGTNYKSWMKSSIMLPDGKRLWMIELGSFVTNSGWINKLVSLNKLSEKHMSGDFAYEAHNTYWGAKKVGKDWGPETRVIFDKVSCGSTRKYIFRGVFRINREESSEKENVWDLIMDEYIF